jgi:hypothetical protein
MGNACLNFYTQRFQVCGYFRSGFKFSIAEFRMLMKVMSPCNNLILDTKIFGIRYRVLSACKKRG